MKPIGLKRLLIALAVLVLTAALLYGTKESVPDEDAELKRAASEKTLACMRAIAEYRTQTGLGFSDSDVNHTGMIGIDYSEITSTLGNLEAKRTSTNPNMAAVVVDMLRELGLEKGDRVAVNCSGSFPALNIAVMCAIDEMELSPMLMTSIGASTHGANETELTYLDMEHYLLERGLLTHKSDYFSIGGYEDVGGNMSASAVEKVISRLKGYGYTFFYEEDLLANIEKRHELYRESGEVCCFINVGGNDVSFGDSKVIVYSGGGILTDLPEKDKSTGLAQLFLRDGVPVVHLLNIRSIASEYGLPIDPVPLPEVGEGGVYFRDHYHKGIAAVGLAAAVCVLFLRGKRGKREPLAATEDHKTAKEQEK